MADRSVLVRLRADISDYQRKLALAAATTSGFVKNLDSADSRMSNMVQTGLALGPALVPMAAVGVPAAAGLTAGLAAAAGAAGVAALAFSGVGDAVKALNEYQLDKTPENLEKVREAMARLGPEGQAMARMLQDLRGPIQELRALGQENMFPGVTDGLEELAELEPQLRRFVANTSAVLGDLAAETGDSLNDDEWVEFFDYIDREGRPILTAIARTVGNVVEGLSGLMMGLDPVADQFWEGMLEGSRDFNEWSKELESDQGFQEFVAYVERVTPKAVDTFGSLVDALAAVVAAAAPVGEATLPVIRALAGVLEAVAESPAGPILIGAAAGLSAVSRAVALYNAANGSAIAGFLGKAGKDGEKAGMGFRGAASGIGILALSLTDVDDNLGMTNTAMGVAIGMMGGPWGAALGGSIGMLLDYRASQQVAAESVSEFTATLDAQTGALTENSREFAVRELMATNATGAARALGIDLELVTDAALGNKDALAEVNAELDKYLDVDITGENGAELQAMATTAAALRDGLNDILGVVGASVEQQEIYAEAMGDSSDAADDATEAIGRYEAAVKHLNGTLDRRAALREYEAALDDFTKALKDNGRAIDINTPKGRAMQEALDGIARRALTVSETLAGADKRRFLTQARQDFVDAATKLYGSEKAAQRLADKLFGLDKTRAKPEVDVDLSKLRAGIDSAIRWMNGIPDEDVYVNIKRRYSTAGGLGVGPAAINNQRENQRTLGGSGRSADPFFGAPTLGRGGLFNIDGQQKSGSGRGSGVEVWLPASVNTLAEKLKYFQAELDKAAKSVEREKRQRDDLIAASEAFAAAVGGAYATADPFAGGLSDFDAATAANTNDSNAANAALAAAAAQGLDGPLYQALAASGNLALLQEFAGLTAAEIDIKEQQFATQSQAQATLGNAAADHEYKQLIKEQTKELIAAQKERRELTQVVKQLEHRVEKGAERGTRQGHQDKDRNTQAFVRTGH